MERQKAVADATVTDCLGGLMEGTLVLTLSGAIPVEALAPGDRIVTRSGARKLVACEPRLLPRARVICISASALGPDRPEEDIRIAPGQTILVRDWRARALAGADHARIAAVDLCDGEYIRAEARRDARFFTLHFDAPEVIYAQGLELPCEPVRVTA